MTIGGTNATTINIGRTGQTEAMLGNLTVAGTSTLGDNVLFSNQGAARSITGPNDASLTVAAGAGQALNLTGNAT